MPPSDGAFELGVNTSAERLASAQSSRLNKSASSIKRRTNFDKLNDAFRVDRYSDLRRQP